jgi:hypothetical protein
MVSEVAERMVVGCDEGIGRGDRVLPGCVGFGEGRLLGVKDVAVDEILEDLFRFISSVEASLV